MKKILFDTIKKYKFIIFLTILFIAINMYILTLPAKIIGIIIDLLYDLDQNKQQIITYTYYLIGTLILALLVRLPWRYLVGYIPRSIEKDIKNNLFNHFTRVRLHDIQKIKNGEIMSYFVKDINEIRSAIYRILSYGTRIVFTGIIVGYTMISGINLNLTLATLCPILITAYIIIVIKKYVEINFQKAQKHFTSLSEYVQESTDAIRTTKTYSQEYYQLKGFIRKNKKLKYSNNAVDVHSTLLSTCINICFGLCYGISILYGSKLVLEGNITVGDFVAFNGYIALFVGPIEWLPSIISRFKRAQISYGRLDRFFELEKEKLDVKSKKIMEELDGNIVIKNLNYNYPESLNIVLEDINVEIKKGKTLGIIGTIGSGKTTLLNILVGLYPVKRGKVFIDGKDINDIPITVLRENISYITQENFLFSTTLKENVNLFRDMYDDFFIDDSVKNAMIYDEIKFMPKELDTTIGGDDGVELSGGQKQRMAISRAFLKRSNIVFLDDTFSALDNKTEKQVLDNINNLTENKTCIIVSNRISDIKNSDEIIVMDEGKIIERGTHESLLNEKKRYYSFYLQQSTKEEESDINE